MLFIIVVSVSLMVISASRVITRRFKIDDSDCPRTISRISPFSVMTTMRCVMTMASSLSLL